MHQDQFKEVKEVGIAVGVTALACLLSVLLFAFIVKIASVDGAMIPPINRIIQTLSVFLGCVIGIHGEKGLIKGLAAGLLSAILSYVLFSCIGGGFSFSWVKAVEWLLCTVAGGISGIIAVNVRK